MPGEFDEVALGQERLEEGLVIVGEARVGALFLKKLLGGAVRGVEVETFLKVGAGDVGDEGAKAIGVGEKFRGAAEAFAGAAVGRDEEGRVEGGFLFALFEPENERGEGEDAEENPKPKVARADGDRLFDVADVAGLRERV